MIDLARTRWIVTAWPDHRWPVEITWWIEKLLKGVTPLRPDYRDSVNKRDQVCARNTAIVESALASPKEYQWFVFLDHDVRPNELTARFLELDADVKCCEVPMELPMAWDWPDKFHDALWCTSRNVLDAIKPPWFMQSYNENGTEMEGCICQSFRSKVIEAGFSIAHGGWADHDRDGSWC